jgi:hypothetical protein
MNSPDEQMRAVKTAMGKDDPAVAVLGTMASKIGSMEDSIQDMTGKIAAIHETGLILRVGRLRNFLFSLITGIVLGAAGTWYWMSGHGFMGGFWAHGVKVRTIENSDRLELKVSGDNIDTLDYVRDPAGKIIGFEVIYVKEIKP